MAELGFRSHAHYALCSVDAYICVPFNVSYPFYLLSLRRTSNQIVNTISYHHPYCSLLQTSQCHVAMQEKMMEVIAQDISSALQRLKDSEMLQGLISGRVLYTTSVSKSEASLKGLGGRQHTREDLCSNHPWTMLS